MTRSHLTSQSQRRRGATRSPRGEVGTALELAEQAVEITERCDLSNRRALVWLSLAEVRRAAGQHDEADVAVAAALGLYEAKGNVAAAENIRVTVLS